MSKISSFKTSGNSTSNTPVLTMSVDGFQVEIASETDRGDKELTALRGIAKKIRKRYNAYDGMLMELEEALKDLENWDGTGGSLQILKDNITDRIKKAKR